MCTIRNYNSKSYKNLLVGMNLWVSIVVASTNVIGTLYYIHYSKCCAICDNILQSIADTMLLKCENFYDIDIDYPNVTKW